MPIIILHKNFIKAYTLLSLKNKKAFKKRRDLFLKDINSPLLRNHPLHGVYDDYRSFNVTGDLRVIYKEIEKNTYVFVMIGSHSDLYS
jgi:addiction module RelE/StbE family toxin